MGDFKLFSFDSSWTWEWSQSFASALGSIINDMVEAPTGPLLQLRGTPKPTPWKRKADLGSGEEHDSGSMLVDSSAAVEAEPAKNIFHVDTTPQPGEPSPKRRPAVLPTANTSGVNGG